MRCCFYKSVPVEIHNLALMLKYIVLRTRLWSAFLYTVHCKLSIKASLDPLFSRLLLNGTQRDTEGTLVRPVTTNIPGKSLKLSFESDEVQQNVLSVVSFSMNHGSTSELFPFLHTDGTLLLCLSVPNKHKLYKK